MTAFGSAVEQHPTPSLSHSLSLSLCQLVAHRPKKARKGISPLALADEAGIDGGGMDRTVVKTASGGPRAAEPTAGAAGPADARAAAC